MNVAKAVIGIALLYPAPTAPKAPIAEMKRAVCSNAASSSLLTWYICMTWMLLLKMHMLADDMMKCTRRWTLESARCARLNCQY
jgi:hypothetical protein